ncbi:MAG TPA: DUF3820 family protein [Polyangiaceae bacterium]|nr:DUF3820 family protein [Polyangiaceae bacterium]
MLGSGENVEPVAPDPEALVRLVRARMPFGRYKGMRLVQLPEAYLVWFAQRGFPKGSLGEMLRSVYELKANGLGLVLSDLVARVGDE